MKQTITDEAHVLDRIMYLLEENSVGRLAEADHNFGNFIGKLYETVDQKAMHLRGATG